MDIMDALVGMPNFCGAFRAPVGIGNCDFRARFLASVRRLISNTSL